jgi:hypothetical protein
MPGSKMLNDFRSAGQLAGGTIDGYQPKTAPSLGFKMVEEVSYLCLIQLNKRSVLDLLARLREGTFGDFPYSHFFTVQELEKLVLRGFEG